MTVCKLVLLFSVACLLLCLAAAPATRPSIPNASALQTANSQVQEVFGKDLASARLPQEREALSQKLLGAAEQTVDDPAGRYVLLSKAAELATSIGDLPLALKAIGRIDAEWSVDGLRLKADVLIKSAPLMRTPPDRLEWARNAEIVGDQAAAADQYALAKELNQLAMTVVAPIRNAALSKRLEERAARLGELSAAYAALAPSLTKLQTAPKDPAANLAVGKFEAFIKGDWQSGLPRIALGDDPMLRDLAARDLGAASNPDDRVGIADAWWDLAEQQSGIARRNLQLRAASWYQLAAGTLTGLTKIKAENRIAAVGIPPPALPPAAPSPPVATDKPRVPTYDNGNNSKEADDVIAFVREHYPESVRDVRKFELVRYHEAIEFRGDARRKDIVGSYSPAPREGGGGGICFWGIYEKLDPGRYLIVYRVRAVKPIASGDCCFLDVCHKGVTRASRKPKPNEMEPGKWVSIPISVELNTPTELEYRLWPFDHLIDLDRVYIFRLH